MMIASSKTLGEAADITIKNMHTFMMVELEIELHEVDITFSYCW